MASNGMKGTKTDMSGAKEGKAKYCGNAASYVATPKGKQPMKQRTQGYTPDATPYQGGNG